MEEVKEVKEVSVCADCGEELSHHYYDDGTGMLCMDCCLKSCYQLFRD